MPGDRKHHTDKFRRCVEQVTAKGHAEDSAYAICTTSLQNAGEPIFETAELSTEELNIRLNEGSVAEVRTLVAAGAEPRTLHLLGATGMVRREELNGRKHLVVPVVALMEGVIHAVNASTPEFVSGEVLKKAAASWIGKPVTLGHPVKAGKQCSASDFEIRKASGIGVIMKSEYLEAGRKLSQEAWIDEEKAKLLHPVMYDSLAAGKSEEVSVGAMVVANSLGGNYRGKEYKGAWLETSGDHLAFLPGGRGACSCEMGCGTHRFAMHLVTASEFQPMTDDTLRALADKSLEEMFETVEGWSKAWRAAGSYEKDCPMCHGSGNVDGNPCEVCDGVGTMKDRQLGGKGSGNFGHSGRPGQVGGSGDGGQVFDQSGNIVVNPEQHTKQAKEFSLVDPEFIAKSGATDVQLRHINEFIKSIPKDVYESIQQGDSDAQDDWTVKLRKYMKSAGVLHGGIQIADAISRGPYKRSLSQNAEDRIRYEGGRYLVLSSDGKTKLAEHLSPGAAEEHLNRIEKILAGT